MNNLDTFTIMREEGFFEYGAVIEGKELRGFFDIEEIEYPALKRDIDKQILSELGVVDFIRNKLLNEGKYFKGERDSYRVLLPSENASQVMSYMNSADRKLKRAIKLNKNTPPEYKISSNDEVRAIMKLENIKDSSSK